MQMDTWNCQIRGTRRVCSKYWVLTGRAYWSICLHDSKYKNCTGDAAVTCRCLSCKTISFTRSRRLRSQHVSSVAPLVLAVCLRGNWLLAAFKGNCRSAACILKHMNGITMLSAAKSYRNAIYVGCRCGIWSIPRSQSTQQKRMPPSLIRSTAQEDRHAHRPSAL